MEWRKPPLIEAISATVLVSILNLKLIQIPLIATKGLESLLKLWKSNTIAIVGRTKPIII
jgi:hypothetical protein